MRRRFKQNRTLEERLEKFAETAREAAAHVEPGPERDDLLKKARIAETATHLNAWVSFPPVSGRRTSLI